MPRKLVDLAGIQMSPSPSPLEHPSSLPENRDSRELKLVMRHEMPVAARWAYYDHAAVGPLSGPARRAMGNLIESATVDGDRHWLEWNQRTEQVRGILADSIGATAEELAFVSNTTDGLGIISEGIAWKTGDNLVLPEGEFPSNHYPWQRLEALGVELRLVPTDAFGGFDVAEVARRCDARTRMIAASWVGFASGFRADIAGLAEVARRHGSLLTLDAIQGLGVFPIDVSSLGVDFLTADGHKWLLGPEGFGILYVRRERLEQVEPKRIGWNSVARPFDYSRLELKLRNDARRFEGGSHNMIGAHGLGASVELLRQVGWGRHDDRLAQRVLESSDSLVDRLRSLGAIIHSRRERPHASGIISFSFPERDPVMLRQGLIVRGVILSCRGGRLRAAVHGYNDQHDEDRIILALQELTATAAA